MKSKGNAPPKLKRAVRWVERAIIISLIAIMSILLLIATIELFYTVYLAILNNESDMLLIDLDNILNIFGVFLLVLIGIELLDTIKVYFRENVIHVEVVILVALIAISRKVIVLDLDEYSGFEVISVAAVILALSGGYYLIKKTGSTGFFPKEKREIEDLVVEEHPTDDESDDTRRVKKIKKKTIETPKDDQRERGGIPNPKNLND